MGNPRRRDDGEDADRVGEFIGKFGEKVPAEIGAQLDGLKKRLG